MKLKSSKLRDGIVLALTVGVMSAAGTGVAFAQTAAPQDQKKDQTTTLDEMVVTGTRIQSQTVTASSPVSEINGEEFKATGASRPDDLVNAYPQMSPVFDSFENNGANGYPVMDLRGLGANRTLTLVNGNRLAPGANIAPDISIIPSAIIRRVDLLTGGASAVYGSDAIAGVVNFVLDDRFQGVSLSVGASAYQHDNRNEYLRPLMDKRGFKYPDGNSGFDGFARNIDLVVGSQFADGAGHAMAWLTWRKNEPLFQGDRDYSSCALNGVGSACGGSNTNAAGNFYIYQPDTGAGAGASLNPDGSWKAGYGAPYNYAPINYYQRPDQRYTFGSSASYTINDNFEPYVEMMFANKSDASQIAPSGAFFTDVNMDCANPLLGNACKTFGLDPAYPLTVYVAKRNVEGGPRYFGSENNSYRILGGVRGDLGNTSWTYNLSYLWGRTNNLTRGENDFISSRVRSALTGCTSTEYGTFDGCVLYNVWKPGGVTSAQARALQGTALFDTKTSLKVLNGYVSGDLGWGFPTAKGSPIALVLGLERRVDSYNFTADSISQQGGFSGSGGSSDPLDGSIAVNELFMESAVPLIGDMGILQDLTLDLGYRLSRYTNSSSMASHSTNFQANTYKLGFNADFGMARVRGGFNRAMRAPNAGELFGTRSIGLWGGDDPCAGAAPEYSAAQCALTGVTAAQYGKIPQNAASQNNGMFGGNFALVPEVAKTWTLGVVLTPIQSLTFNVDYYDIKITDAIDNIGARNIIDSCANTGNAFLCGRIHRGPGGNLWRSEAGYVDDWNVNAGFVRFRGLDIGGGYSWDMLGGRMFANMNGSYYLERTRNPVAGAFNYDCAGKISPGACQSPKWRHIASLGWNGNVFGASLRWRYFGSLNYVNQYGNPITKNPDKLVGPNGGVDAYNYFDLTGTMNIGSATKLVVGVNNIFDKEPPMVGGTLTPANANALGGYDQAGRMVFANVTFDF